MPLEEKDQLPYSKSTFLLLFFMQTWICFHLGEIDTYPSHCSCKELDQCWFSNQYRPPSSALAHHYHHYC